MWPRTLKQLFFNWLPIVVYLGAIFYLSSKSNLPSIPGGGWDKAAHFCEYALLGILLVRAFRGHNLTRGRALMLAVFVAGAYGLSDELHQMFTPNRFAEVADLVADTLGATTGAVLWLYFPVLRMGRKTP